MNEEHKLYADHYTITHEVASAYGGWRLDAFLKERYRRRSREQIKDAIARGSITVVRSSAHAQVGRLKPSSQLMPGDEVHVRSERKPEPRVSFDYKILYEDDVLFVINKPPNLPVHPAGVYFFNTLLIHLRTEGFTIPLKAEREFYLVHRIDKETSGVLVLTKDAEVCAGLTEQFRERTTKKRYLAVVHGSPEKDEFEIDLPLRRKPGSLIRLKMAPCQPDSPDALESHTRVRVLSRHGRYSLVECFPKTGRQHQIRVHLEAVGHPLVGDKLYGLPEEDAVKFYERPGTANRRRKLLASGEIPPGNPQRPGTDTLPPRYISPEMEARLVLPRQALHAAGISFRHPVTGERMEFEAPLASDLQEFLELQGPDRLIPAARAGRDSARSASPL